MSIQPQGEFPAEARAGHLPEDTSVRGVTVFGITFVITMAVLHVVIAALFLWFLFGSERAEPPASPLATQRQPPPEPQLQTTPQQDLERLRVAEAAALGSYGWVDRPAGTARIPIAQAMRLAAQGLRAAGSEAPATQPTTQPGTKATSSEDKRWNG